MIARSTLWVTGKAIAAVMYTTTDGTATATVGTLTGGTTATATIATTTAIVMTATATSFRCMG